MCRMKKMLPKVVLTKSEFRRGMGYHFVGSIEAMKVHGKSERLHRIRKAIRRRNPGEHQHFRGWRRERV